MQLRRVGYGVRSGKPRSRRSCGASARHAGFADTPLKNAGREPISPTTVKFRQLSMSFSVSEQDANIVITMPGRFDNHSHGEFRALHASLRGRNQPVVVDFQRTEYMDSSALGMLLCLRQDVGGDAADVTLRNCGDAVSKILAIANFQKLFNIETDSQA